MVDKKKVTSTNEETMFHKNEFLSELARTSAITPHTSKYHQETLETHVLMVVEYVRTHFPEDSVLEVAAYLHDIGKPRTHGVNKIGGNCFYGHEKIERAELAEFLDQEDDDFELVYQLIRSHMLPFAAAGPDPWATAAKEQLRTLREQQGDRFMELLDKLHEADVAACVKAQ